MTTTVADELGGADHVIDLAEHGSELFDFGSATVAGLVEQVRASDLIIVASPTYKATYTGLLKSFLDWFLADALLGTTAVPTRALSLVDRDYDDPAAYAGWLATARPRLAHLTHERAVS